MESSQGGMCNRFQYFDDKECEKSLVIKFLSTIKVFIDNASFFTIKASNY